MKIEIILPDTALCGVLNYVNIDVAGGAADLCNVPLNGLDDGNIYDTTEDEPEVKEKAFIPRTLEAATDYLRSIGWLQAHDVEILRWGGDG